MPTQRARRTTSPILFTALFLLLTAGVASSVGGRTFEFEYVVRVDPIVESAGQVHVFIPLPMDDARQHLLEEEIVSSVPGAIEDETVHGNRFYHLAYSVDGRALDVRVRVTVEREVAQAGRRTATSGPELARYLGENARVVADHPILQPMLEEIRHRARPGASEKKARAIYDWVVDHMEYKKTGRGWGHGDTFWACSERYGNCTDFHALVISLARTEGIPARFEIGFAIPQDRPRGEIDGYHCWVELHLDGIGWLPIDAAEASKHPEKRELFYGSQPADRIHFTTGRDLKLGSDHRGPPLNYFIYPHVEVDGQPYDGPIETRFRYHDVYPLATDPIGSEHR